MAAILHCVGVWMSSVLDSTPTPDSRGFKLSPRVMFFAITANSSSTVAHHLLCIRWTSTLTSTHCTMPAATTSLLPAGARLDSEVQSPPCQNEDARLIAETKCILRDFLARMRYSSPNTPPNATLRAEVAQNIRSWNAGFTPEVIEAVTDTSCSIAESSYPHTLYRHQLLVALYTAQLVYVDDLGARDLDALGECIRRFAGRKDVEHPALQRIFCQFQEIYQYYPHVSADAIITNTVECLVGMHIEYITKNMAVLPGATRYPWFLRLRSGDGSAYSLFNFVKGWNDPSDLYYLQLLPALEHFTIATNDILSFYKEALGGETETYIHLRASAEGKEPLTVLRDVVDETLRSIREVRQLASAHPKLEAICESYLMGYVEFHIRAKRYRLDELEM
ncbi:terpenoid synthase [Trametes sanguinea]|nr:terpenoid synthase [Trametes sanguinea]